jgi:hypothetical protein
LPERGGRKRIEFDGKKGEVLSVATPPPELPLFYYNRADGLDHFKGQFTSVDSKDHALERPEVATSGATVTLKQGTRVLPSADLPSSEIARMLALLMQPTEVQKFTALPERGKATLAEWFRAIDDLPVAQGGAAYRSVGPSRDDIVAILEDAQSDIETRAGAARLLARMDASAVEQSLVRIGSGVAEQVRVALAHAEPTEAAAAFADHETAEKKKHRRFGP